MRQRYIKEIDADGILVRSGPFHFVFTKEKDTAIFHVSFEKKEICGEGQVLQEHFELKFVSVTNRPPI